MLDDRVQLLRAPTGWSGAPRFVRRIRVPVGHGRVVSATLAVTAEGIVEPAIDGAPVAADVLSPGWTAYPWRLRVVEHDVRDRIGAPGSEHELSLLAGNGWFSGRLGWMGASGVYGDRPGVAAALRMTFEDGAVVTVRTDERWGVVASTVLADDLYDGETIDLRVAPGREAAVVTAPLDPAATVPALGPPVVRHESIAPVAVRRLDDGRTLVDFGQNLVGWLRLRVRGPAGHRLVLQHAEVLEHGDLARRPLRSARAEDVVVLSGGDDDVEPTLTFHGFRYATIEGWDAVSGAVEAVVVGSDLRRIGRFACSDPLLDRFHRNVVWSLRGNTVGIPSDCPQRDERLGWTGDIAVFAPTACFLVDMRGFLRDWLADLRAEQAAAHGRVPYVVPDPLKGWAVRPGQQPESTAIWSDAAVWVPWALWEATGDPAVLRESYPSMRDHLDRVLARCSPRGVWEGDFQFGDWLDPTAPPDDPFAAVADPDVIATAALHRSLDLTARAASAIGLHEEAAGWASRAAELRAAFAAAYVTADGRIRSDAPAVYALAIVGGVLDPAATASAGRRLAELVREAGHRINAGFVGAPLLCDALTSTGHLVDAYALLTNRAAPSWLHPVELGATTVWERWDSVLDDGTVNPGEMTSFNHYALGAVADWMHRTIGGIRALAPGYARVRIAPRPGGGLTWARASHVSPHGLIAVAWRRDPVFAFAYCAPDGVAVEVPDDLLAAGTRVDAETMVRLLAHGDRAPQPAGDARPR